MKITIPNLPEKKDRVTATYDGKGGYTVHVPSSLLTSLEFGEVTKEAFVRECNEAIKRRRS